MKPRIFIGMHYMELGGVETSLVGLLQVLDYSRVDVDLFIYSHQGPMMNYIPQNVNLLPEIEIYSLFECPIKSVIMKGYFRLAFARLFAKFRNYVYCRMHRNDRGEYWGTGFLGKYVSKVMPDLDELGRYDLAISFVTPHNFVLDHVCAEKKVCWIHTDYSKVDINYSVELPVWQSYDNIVSISHDVTCSFLNVFPSLESKIVEIENILSTDFVRKRARETHINLGRTNSIVLLTIGRFTWQKNMESIPEICKRIRESGRNVNWYIIGYGSCEALIRQKIDEAGMQNNVIILGKKDNPYPYIKNCDIYVQPSRYEGKSVTVREAQMLHKPVIITDYPTASSQVKNGVDGVIVPMDNNGCAKGIVEFIHNNMLQKSIVKYLETHDYGNESEVDKIYALL